MITKIDHLGIAVKDLESSIHYYENILGLKCEGREDVEAQNVKTAFIRIGDIHIELLEATNDESPISKFIQKNGEGLHHIAFSTTDINKEIESVKKNGIRLIHEMPFEGASNKWVAFMHPKSTFGVLTELCQNNKNH